VIKLGTGRLALADLRAIAREAPPLGLEPAAIARMQASEAAVGRILASGKPAYGINTGFGRLSQTRIAEAELEQLQRNIVLSHAAGTGPFLGDAAVRLTLALKIESLARGYSGVRRLLVERLLELYDRRLYPRIPAKGSVGASGDLAPLAHLSLALLGIGDVQHPQPIKLAPKEGLALLNGTQVSTALALVLSIAACNGSSGSQGPAGPQGPPGPKGDQGPKGDIGSQGVDVVAIGERARAPATVLLLPCAQEPRHRARRQAGRVFAEQHR